MKMEYTIHTVKKDDSFNRLAHRYNSSAKEILEIHNQTANPQKPLTIASIIHPGDKIHIPIKNKATDGTAYALFEFFNDEIVMVNTLVNYYGITVKALNDYNGKEIESPIINTPVKVPIKIYTTTDQKSTIEGDNTSSLGISTPTACEDGLLIIQVTGINHPQGQRIAIEDKNNKELSSTDTAANTTQNTLKKLDIETIKEDEQRLTCHLHKWDWDDNQTKDQRNLSLIINKAGGGEIRLPFAEDIGETPRQNDAQLIQIIPIVPFTMLKSTSPYDKGVPVLARTGYLYIYEEKTGGYSGLLNAPRKLWREIQIRQDEKTGKTTYHDIELSNHYDSEKGEFTEDTRQAIGVALEEVWLPRTWRPKNSRKTGYTTATGEKVESYITEKVNYRIEYSEVQLSAARLNYLHSEAGQNLPKTPDIFYGFTMAQVQEAYSGGIDINHMLTTSSSYNIPLTGSTSSKIDRLNFNLAVKCFPFPIKYLPPLRHRELSLEWELDYPARYLYDVKGSTLQISIDYPANYLKWATSLAGDYQNAYIEKASLNLEHLEITAWKTKIFDTLADSYQKILADIEKELQTKRDAQQFMSQIFTFSIDNLKASDGFVFSKIANAVKGATTPDKQDNTQLSPTTRKTLLARGANSLGSQYYDEEIAELEEQREHYKQEIELNNKQKALWNIADKGENAIADLQERDIYGVIVEDTHYQVRHLVQRMRQCQVTVAYAIDQAQQFEHSHSALLVQKTLAPIKMGKQNNPLRQGRVVTYLKEGAAKIAKHSGAVQRYILKTYFERLQKVLCETLKQEIAQKTWGHHLSLEDTSQYVAAYLYAAQVFALLGQLPEQIDPLYTPNEIITEREFYQVNQDRIPQHYLLDISGNLANPYNFMIWEELKDEDQRLKDNYQKPEPTINYGTGIIRPDRIIEMAKYASIPEASNITLDTQAINDLMTKGNLGQLVEWGIKAGLDVINSIGANLITNINTAYMQLTLVNQRVAAVNQADAAAAVARNTHTQSRQAITNVSRVRTIRLYGLDENIIPINNFQLFRVLNGDTPLSEVALQAITDRVEGDTIMRERPAGRKSSPTNTGPNEVLQEPGERLLVRRNAQGEVTHINDYPLERASRRTILFDGSHNQFTAHSVSGKLYSETGEILGDTRQASARAAGLDTAQPQTYIAVVFDDNSNISQLMDNEHTARTNAIATVENAVAARNIHGRLYGQNGLLAMRRQFLTTYHTNLRRMSGIGLGILASPHFATGMFIFKSVGLFSEIKNYSDNAQQKGSLRAFIGFVSAFADMAFAAEEIVFRLRIGPNFLTQWRLSANALEAANVRWTANTIMRSIRLGNVPYLPLLQGVFAIAGSVASAIDLAYAFEQDDNTMTKVGYGLIFSGAVIGIFSIFLGPLAWIGLILAGIGTYILFKNPTSPIETWLSNGPFGKNQADSLKFLQNSEIAYYRLLNILANIQISVNNNPLRSNALKGEFKDLGTEFNRRMTAPKIIEITSAIPGLIDTAVNYNAITEYKYVSRKMTFVFFSATVQKDQPQIMGIEPIEGGKRIYVEDPNISGISSALPDGMTVYDDVWSVRAQFKITLKDKLWVLPAEQDIKKAGELFNPAQHSTANFEKYQQSYWADEISHGKPRTPQTDEQEKTA